MYSSTTLHLHSSLSLLRCRRPFSLFLFSVHPAAIDDNTKPKRRKTRVQSSNFAIAAIFPRSTPPLVKPSSPSPSPSPSLSLSSSSSMPVFLHCLQLGGESPARHSLEFTHCIDDVVLETEEKEKERRVLKEKLMKSLEHPPRANQHDDCEALIDQLSKVNPFPDLTLPPFLYKGCFQAVKTSFRGISSTASSASSCVTLGHASFNVFAPRHLPLTVTRAFNHVGVESDRSYLLIVEFSLVVPTDVAPEDHNSSPHPPLLHGVLINTAAFRILGPARMGVSFVSSTLRIQNPNSHEELELWNKLFKDCNPGMDDRGSVSFPLPPATGHVDYLYMDEEMRITRGNRGGLLSRDPVFESHPLHCELSYGSYLVR